MRTLQEFWRWFENEKPAPADAAFKCHGKLSDVGEQALRESALMVHDRSGEQWNSEEYGNVNSWALGKHPEQLKALSLSLCAALVKMHESVADVRPAPARTVIGVDPGKAEPATMWWAVNNTAPMFKREYTMEWLDAQGITFNEHGPLPNPGRAGGKTERMRRIFEAQQLAVAERLHCIKAGDPCPADGRFCVECLSKPCRHSDARAPAGEGTTP